MVSSDDDGLVSRQELLEGRLAPGRQANAVLFATKAGRHNWSLSRNRWAAPYLTAKAVEEAESVFLEAMAAVRNFPGAPHDSRTSSVTHPIGRIWSPKQTPAFGRRCSRFGQQVHFTHKSVPGIRTALGLDENAVQRVYVRLYNESLSAIYASRTSWRDRLRWACQGWLPGWKPAPFWVAFVLTLPLGTGQLALPIAVAGVGPLVGVLLLIVFGLINALTAAALAESVARSGTTRFGLGYLGQLVSEYLGSAGSVVLPSRWLPIAGWS